MLYSKRFWHILPAFVNSMDIQERDVSFMYPGPIVVHQMGKVGSKTVELSLRKAYEALGIQVPIYHTHVLNGFDSMKQYVIHEQNRQNPIDALAALEHGESIRKLIDENPTQHWKVISLVRDPVARNMSAFFESLHEYMPDWRERYAQGSLSAYEIRALFLHSGTAYENAEDWFKWQMKAIPAFGIDVYATPFPCELGYKIYPGTSQASLLLIRLESLQACAEIAMQEFLGLKNFRLLNTNTADEKEYAPLYRAFNELPLPTVYVEEMYKTQLARHFYSDAELDRFKKRWTRGTEVADNTLSSDKQLAELEKSVQLLTVHVVEKTRTIRTLQERNAELIAALEKSNFELSEIKSSKAWRLAMFLRSVRLRLLPPNRFAAKVARQFVNFILLPFRKKD